MKRAYQQPIVLTVSVLTGGLLGESADSKLGATISGYEEDTSGGFSQDNFSVKPHNRQR